MSFLQVLLAGQAECGVLPASHAIVACSSKSAGAPFAAERLVQTSISSVRGMSRAWTSHTPLVVPMQRLSKVFTVRWC